MPSDIMRKKLTRHFQFQDFNKDGFVERADWEQCARNLAGIRKWASDSTEYEAILKRHILIWMNNWQPADSDGNGKVSLPEYLELADELHAKNRQSYLDQLLDLFGAIFDVIDIDSDGIINLDDYKNYFKAWGVDEYLAESAFTSIDLNGDGELRRMSFIQFGANFFISDDENEFANMLFGPLD